VVTGFLARLRSFVRSLVRGSTLDAEMDDGTWYEIVGVVGPLGINVFLPHGGELRSSAGTAAKPGPTRASAGPS
jgi:hypothetical protein